MGIGSIWVARVAGHLGVLVWGGHQGSQCHLHTSPPDCRCSPLGATLPQCHENSTCVCRPGFVGYKCDRCQDNFFLTASGRQCQECPSCYALVKEEVSPPRLGPAQAGCAFCSFHAPSKRQLCAGCWEVPTYPWSFWGYQPPPSCAHPAIWLSSPLCPFLVPEWTREKWARPYVLLHYQTEVSHLLTFGGDEDTDGPLWGGSGGGRCSCWNTSRTSSREVM